MIHSSAHDIGVCPDCGSNTVAGSDDMTPASLFVVEVLEKHRWMSLGKCECGVTILGPQSHRMFREHIAMAILLGLRGLDDPELNP